MEPRSRAASHGRWGTAQMRRRRLSDGLSFLRRVWSLAAPYWRSEERWRARLLLAAIVALTLAQVALQVLYNSWNRDFFNALQEYDAAAFLPLLGRFAVLAGLFI